MAKPKVLDPIAAKKKKKKIIIIIAIAALVVLIGGGIGGCFACNSIQAKNFENKVKKIVEESQSEGKSLAEQFEQGQELKNLEDLTDDVNDLKEKIQTDSDTISELNTSGGKNQVIKDKTVDYLEKYETYLVSLKETIEQYTKEEETASTEDEQTTTTTTEEGSETEEVAAGEETKDLQEKGDEVKTAYEDLKKEASEIITADFEQKITTIPLMVQALIEGRKISDLQQEQEAAAEKAAEEAAAQTELEQQRAANLQKAQSTMTQFENALKSNDLNGFYNTTTSEFQSSADGQAIATSIQGAGTGLKSYIIKSSSRVNDQKYRFVVRETYEVGGVQTSETKTYDVIKSGTRWLVDNIL